MKSLRLGDSFMKKMFGLRNTLSIEKFVDKLRDLYKELRSEAHRSFLADLKGENFSKAYFLDYMTFDVHTNNLAESANSTFKAFRDLPIDMLVYSIVNWCVQSFVKRQKEALEMNNSQGVVPYAVTSVKQNMIRGKEMQIQSGCDYTLVHDGTMRWKVAFEKGEDNTIIANCACLFYRDTGLPCAHIAAAANASKIEIFPLVSSIYWLETYKEVWSTRVGLNPIDWNPDEAPEDAKIETPIVKPPKGRPKKLRSKSWIERLASVNEESQKPPRKFPKSIGKRSLN
ncbi:MAG: hypothetical protein EOP04_25255 [Proteobacteria bacterium]|nr:MAG: hypothetical protein EOP04_25255 [Pseudomonadota bacterium]